MIGILIGSYLAGFLGTLLLLHKTDGLWGNWNHYDPPHEGWYDDYDSNAQAYLSFSIIWPIFIPVNLISGGWNLLMKFSKYLGNNE